eukprot:520165-Pyramimonas_sp.AAC.2
MLWSLACRLVALPALCRVPHGVAGLLMGANDACRPATAGWHLLRLGAPRAARIQPVVGRDPVGRHARQVRALGLDP